MTYDTSRQADARVPVWVVRLYLDDCSNTYGVSPCTASGAAGSECYNTFSSCQDTANFAKTSKTYTFYEPVSNWPIGEIGFPCLTGGVDFTPCKIDPTGSLGQRGVVSINLSDFADDDLFTDPYVSTRSYTPELQGSFFGKVKSRSRYYKGRLMEVGQGYINTPFDSNDFEWRTYIIESINVDQAGKVKIVGKDLLKLTDAAKAVALAVSTGTLSADITAAATSLTLQAGEGADYDSSGQIAIGDEDISYTSITTDTLNGLTRGINGTTASSHNADDTVQQCLVYTATNVVDIIDDLLKNYAGIAETYIPYDAGLAVPTGTNDEWDDEKATWLSGNDLTKTVREPTGVGKLIERICKQNLIYMWADDRSSKIKLKAIAPKVKNEAPPTLTDGEHIIEKSISAKDTPENRISQVWVHYDLIDPTKELDKVSNYNRHKVVIDTTSENVNAFDEKAIKHIYADWLYSGNAGLVITLAGRMLSRYAGVPSIVKFKLDHKDAGIWTGNVAVIDSFAFQDDTGANRLKKIQVLKIKDNHDKQTVDIEAESWDYQLVRYGFIGPNTLGDYTTETTANQDGYCYICQNDGYYTNGDGGHLIA